MNNKLLNPLKKSLIWIIGFSVVFIYLYSNMVFGKYKLSYTNLLYESSPWNTTSTKTDGPLLSDAVDSALPSIYSEFYLGQYTDKWNSNIAMGAKADTFDKLYPIDAVYLLPIDVALVVKSVLEFGFAFLSMYFLLKYMKIRKSVSAAMAIAYSFSSVMVMWHGWPHSDVTAFAPFIILFTMKLIDSIRLRDMVFLSLAIYMTLIGGMPTYAAYFLYVTGFYLVIFTLIKYWNNKKNIIKVWLYFGAAAILGILCSVPYTVELLSSVGSNGYSDSRSAYATQILGSGYLRTMIYPYFRQGFSLHINESTIYAGIVAVILLPLTIIGIKRKKQSIYFAVMAVINGLLIFTHMFDDVFKLMPAINSSLKYRVIVVFVFCIIIVAAVNLNDVIENASEYRKIWFIFIPAYAAVCWCIYYFSSKGIKKYFEPDNGLEWSYIKCGIIIAAVVIIVAGYLFIYKWKYAVNIVMCAIGLLVIWDSAHFANNYLPWIEKSSPAIPKATDTIKYLQDNTKENERFIALGGWVLFPNTNLYYGLNDVRTHNFVMTNEDMKTYYSALRNDEKQPEACVTSTRVAYTEINNMSLLKYMGVKYIVGNRLGDLEQIGYLEESDKSVVGLMTKGIVVEQKLSVNDKFIGVDLATGTYGHKTESETPIIFELIDSEDRTVEKIEIPFSKFGDNLYYRIGFENMHPAGNYRLIISIEGDVSENLTMWINNTAPEGFAMKVNNEPREGSLIMNMVYESEDYSVENYGNDGLMTGELFEYSKKVEPVTNIVKCKNEAEVLDNMSEKYLSNTMFTTEQLKNVSTDDLGANEYVNISKYDNDEIVIKYSFDEDRYILVNDYYDSNWKAYIDGKETDLIKSNYLTRAVYVKAGENKTVILKYNDEFKDKLYIIMISSFAILIVLFIIDAVYSKKKNALVCKREKER